MKTRIFILVLMAAMTALAQSLGTFAALPGVRLWYVDSGGTGVPVVLLHAATGTSSSWEKQRQPFITAGYRVIAFDRRGWGRTESDPAAQPGTAADDLEKLADYLKLGKFHVVGTAAGGFVAIDFAISFPNRLRSLVLTHTIGGIIDPEYLELGRRLRPSPQFDALSAELRELGPAYRAAEKEGTERWIALQRASRPPGAAAAQPLKNRITFASIESIETPSLLISGGADMFAPPPVMQQIVRHIRNSQFVNIPDAGHSGYWETPEKYNHEVLRFLRKH